MQHRIENNAAWLNSVLPASAALFSATLRVLADPGLPAGCFLCLQVFLHGALKQWDADKDGDEAAPCSHDNRDPGLLALWHLGQAGVLGSTPVAQHSTGNNIILWASQALTTS